MLVELTNEILEKSEHEIVVETAYLIPTKDGIARTGETIQRGVRVRMLTNSLRSNNHSTVHAHYMKYRKRMIEAGIELHELRPDPEILEHFKQVDSRIAESHAGLHTKAFVVDRRYSLIGSYNMDPRSRIWNSEIGLLIDSEEFAETVLAIMEKDLEPANSYRLTLNEKGKLEWTADGPNGPRVWNKEPDTSAWKRFTLGPHQLDSDGEGALGAGQTTPLLLSPSTHQAPVKECTLISSVSPIVWHCDHRDGFGGIAGLIQAGDGNRVNAAVPLIATLGTKLDQQVVDDSPNQAVCRPCRILLWVRRLSHP